jgi:hypothetical protein
MPIPAPAHRVLGLLACHVRSPEQLEQPIFGDSLRLEQGRGAERQAGAVVVEQRSRPLERALGVLMQRNDRAPAGRAAAVLRA